MYVIPSILFLLRGISIIDSLGATAVGLSGPTFEHFVSEVCGWGVDDTRGVKGMVVIPINKENEAKGTVVKEEVKFDRKSFTVGTSRIWDMMVNELMLACVQSSRE